MVEHQGRQPGQGPEGGRLFLHARLVNPGAVAGILNTGSFVLLASTAILAALVAFGDSTTADRKGVTTYAARLEAALGIPVINAGVPGNHTEDARRRFNRDVLAHRPAVVIIQFGLNDAAVDVWKEPPASGPRVRVESYRRNLAFFIAGVREQGGAAILMTPNPMAWTPRLRELYGKPPYDTGTEEGINRPLTAYVHAVREVAHRLDVPLVDVYSTFSGNPQGVSALLLDGMHPNNTGHAIIAELLLPAVRRLADLNGRAGLPHLDTASHSGRGSGARRPVRCYRAP